MPKQLTTQKQRQQKADRLKILVLSVVYGYEELLESIYALLDLAPRTTLACSPPPSFGATGNFQKSI